LTLLIAKAIFNRFSSSPRAASSFEGAVKGTRNIKVDTVLAALQRIIGRCAAFYAALMAEITFARSLAKNHHGQESPREANNIQALDVLVRFRGLWAIFFHSKRVNLRTLIVCLSCHLIPSQEMPEFDCAYVRKAAGWVGLGRRKVRPEVR
jgi:hypothetical protein